jgi:hypothetical protein
LLAEGEHQKQTEKKKLRKIAEVENQNNNSRKSTGGVALGKANESDDSNDLEDDHDDNFDEEGEDNLNLGVKGDKMNMRVKKKGSKHHTIKEKKRKKKKDRKNSGAQSKGARENNGARKNNGAKKNPFATNHYKDPDLAGFFPMEMAKKIVDDLYYDQRPWERLKPEQAESAEPKSPPRDAEGRNLTEAIVLDVSGEQIGKRIECFPLEGTTTSAFIGGSSTSKSNNSGSSSSSGGSSSSNRAEAGSASNADKDCRGSITDETSTKNNTKSAEETQSSPFQQSISAMKSESSSSSSTNGDPRIGMRTEDGNVIKPAEERSDPSQMNNSSGGSKSISGNGGSSGDSDGGGNIRDGSAGKTVVDRFVSKMTRKEWIDQVYLPKCRRDEYTTMYTDRRGPSNPVDQIPHSFISFLELGGGIPKLRQ